MADEARGEFELIASIRDALGPPPEHVVLGIGDDAAILAPPAGRELVMTTDNPPADASPLTVVAVHQTGFYLLGFVPFAPVRLEDCVAELVDKAQSMGADGVANLKVDYMPAALFKFAAFPVPDWSAAISLSGMTYRMPWNAAYPAQPGPK